MIKNIYAVRDLKSCYINPVVDDSDAHAIRSFQIAMKNPQTDVHYFPSDFQLCKIGTFDDKTGVIKPCDLEVIFDGKDCSVE